MTRFLVSFAALGVIAAAPAPASDPAARRVTLDVFYIDHQSFWLDVWMMVMTIPSVLGDRSAIR